MSECIHATIKELVVGYSIKIYQCADCGDRLIAVLEEQIGESKLWKKAVPVKGFFDSGNDNPSELID